MANGDAVLFPADNMPHLAVSSREAAQRRRRILSRRLLPDGRLRTQLLHEPHHLKELFHVRLRGPLHGRRRRRLGRRCRSGDRNVEPIGKLIDELARQKRRKRFDIGFHAGASVLVADGFAQRCGCTFMAIPPCNMVCGVHEFGARRIGYPEVIQMNINEQYENYRKQSSDELMETLMRLTAEQKQTGEMTESKMEEIYRMLSPMLSEGQKAKMREIIDRLNRPI